MINLLRSRLDAITAPDAGFVHSDFDLNRKDKAVLDQGKAAAVLVPLVLRADGWQVILTRRSDAMPTHAGQISFPGGRSHTKDSGLEQTALRECEEEIGVQQKQIKLLGKFELYHTVTDYRITPFVGLIEGNAVLHPDPREVAEVFEVPFAFLSDLNNFRKESRLWQGRERFFYALPWKDRYIWGATAGMLRALALRLADKSNEISK